MLLRADPYPTLYLKDLTEWLTPKVQANQVQVSHAAVSHMIKAVYHVCVLGDKVLNAWSLLAGKISVDQVLRENYKPGDFMP